MNAPVPHTLFDGPLRRGQFLRFADMHTLCVQAEAGTLWVTVDGQSADLEIEAGTSRRFQQPAPVIIGALGGEARLRVRGTRPAPRDERLARWAATLALSARRALGRS